MSRATAFPAQTTHTHTGGKRVGVPEVLPSVTTTLFLSLLCALEDEESVSRGCLGASLGWFSPGAMVPFPGGSIGERVLRGPARKGITTVQRAGRDTPYSHNTSNHNNPRVTAFGPLDLPHLCPGR